MGKASKDETLNELREYVRKNFALCYWNEDSLTEDGGIPKEHTIEPMKFIERVANACMRNPGSSTSASRKIKGKRYIWMVTIDGSSQGDYENCASSCLFSTYEEAVGFIKEDLVECVINTVFTGIRCTEEELERAVDKYCRWFDGKSAQFRYGDCVMDYKVERVAIPPIKMSYKKRRSRK